MCSTAVYHTVLDALDKTGAPAAVPAKEPPLAAASRQDFFQTMDAKTFRQGGGGRAPARPARTEARPAASSPSAWNTELRAPAKVADSRQTSFYQAGLPAGQSALGRAPASAAVPAEGQQTPPTPAHRSALGQPPASVAAERPALQTPRPPAQPPKEAAPPAALRAGHPAGAAEADGGPAGPDCPEGESRPLAHRRGGAEHLHHL